MRTDLPSGMVTLVFTDIEGSTRLLHELGSEAYAEALGEHRRLLRGAFEYHGGVEVDTQGDALFCVFADARDAVAAAEEGCRALRPGHIHVRIGIHTGTPHLSGEGYVGDDVHLGARIGASGHGGQVLLSDETRRSARLDDDGLLDLGDHRLKDFEKPVRIFQLGSERFPPLKTISNTNLPRPASSFVGREREVRELTKLILDGARLVTLTGPGGSGKTRLAIEVAADLVGDHRAGTFWVELAPIRDPILVTDEIAKTLGAKDSLADHINEREMLLVLDNLEQVIDAAPTLADLVEACPNLAVLTTSRERLRVRGEMEVEVRPLAEPDAVELFMARAGLRNGSDDAVRELCRALDEMPLSIELAAARAKVLTPAQILERLSQRLDLFIGGRDADPRQRTLRRTIEWSNDLLDAREQRLFARLAVFAGGGTLDAAERIADADLDTLQSLVDKSLVRRTDDRFSMYETIHEYALERLAASGEVDAVGRRHAEYFLELAEEAEPHLRRVSDEWLDRLDPEHDNVWAAIDLFEMTGQHELELRLCAAFWWFWSLRGGYIRQGRRRVELALARDERPTLARANALTAAGDLALDEGDNAAGRQRAREALDLHRALGNAWGVAYSLLTLGHGIAFDGGWADALPIFEESARLFEDLGEEHWALQATRKIGESYEDIGDIERARRVAEENIPRARAIGDRFIEARSLASLGQCALDEGRIEDAVSLLAEAHRMHHASPNGPDRYSDVILVCRFARALAIKGKAEATVRLLGCSEAAFEKLDMNEANTEPWLVKMNGETSELIRRDIGGSAAAAAWEEGRELTVDEAVTLALDSLL